MEREVEEEKTKGDEVRMVEMLTWKEVKIG